MLLTSHPLSDDVEAVVVRTVRRQTGPAVATVTSQWQDRLAPDCVVVTMMSLIITVTGVVVCVLAVCSSASSSE